MMISSAVLAILISSSVGEAAAVPFDINRHDVVAAFHAEGAQVYECKAQARGAPRWTFREPIATLIENGKTVGRHFAGPHWMLDDGSIVQGALVQSLPGATASDVGLLKLKAVEHSATGRFQDVRGIYRVHTHGGALMGECSTPGALRPVAYSADYIFTR